MNADIFRHGRIFYALLLAAGLAACGSSGGSDSDDDDDDNDPPPVTFACEGSGSVTVSGKVRYEFVPSAPSGGSAFLDFDNSEFRPIREAEVQAVCPDGSVEYDSTFSDANGDYSLTVPENVDVQIRVRASMQQDGAPGWDVQVVDNTASQAVWTAAGEAVESGTGSFTANLDAASGWNGASYSGTRAAGPFAILDSVYTAMQRVLGADPNASFPPLKLNWSPDNRACSGTSFPFSNGCIGTSFFANFGATAGRNIFILGDAGSDTDEYDNHVVIHEWGHYYEDAFARSDSIGGAHGGGDELDLRVAFGEGWGNAWSGIATDDPVYVDTFGTGTSGFWFNVEDEDESNPGWWSETTVQEIVYDLYDDDLDGGDTLSLGFDPLHAVLTDEQRDTESVTSIFPLIHFLKTVHAMGSAVAIDTLVTAQDIATISDEWGDSRTAADDGSEFGQADAISPVHDDLGLVTDGSTRNDICTTNVLDSASEHNRLGTRRFLRFEVDTAGAWEARLVSPAASNDPDFFIYASGAELTDSTQQGVPASGVDNSANNAAGEGAGVETATVTLDATTQYVIEVVEYLNVDGSSGTGGDICLDLSFEKL